MSTAGQGPRGGGATADRWLRGRRRRRGPDDVGHAPGHRAPCAERSSQPGGSGPPAGTRPCDVFMPDSPQHEDGIRIEPPPSEPVARGTMPAARAAADPPEEPPGVRVEVPRVHRDPEAGRCPSWPPIRIPGCWSCPPRRSRRPAAGPPGPSRRGRPAPSATTSSPGWWVAGGVLEVLHADGVRRPAGRGRPRSPRSGPRRAACSRARSPSTATKAPTIGLSASMRARAPPSAPGPSSWPRTCRASSTTEIRAEVHPSRAQAAGRPEPQRRPPGRPRGAAITIGAGTVTPLAT